MTGVYTSTTQEDHTPFLFFLTTNVKIHGVKMKHISAALLLSVLLFHTVLADALKDQTLNKDLLERTRRAVAHQGLINPADMRMLKIRRSDPYRRAPRMKRYRRMAENPEMFKRGPKSDKFITRVKKIVKS